MLSFSLLGRVTVSDNDQLLTQFRSQKELAILIFLAHTGESHARDFVAELLWESRSTKQSLTNLRTALTRLRKLVDDSLLITRKSVALDPENLQQVDSTRLIATLESVQHIHSPADAERLHLALNTYRGDFLADFVLTNAPRFNEWAMMTREHLRRQVLAAFNKLAQFQYAIGDVDAGLVVVRRWLEIDQLDEAAHMIMIRLLIKADRMRDAARHYEQYVQLLRTELGIEPSAAMVDLLTSNQSPPAIALQPRTAAHHNNLPVFYDQFFGRSHVQEEIQVRLDQPWCRLITIMGQGGIGKTRLATVIARSRVNSYPDGVWFVELANLESDDEDVAEAIAVEIAIALDFRLSGSAKPVDQLFDYLQHKRMLLVLDNFEHIIEDGVQLVLDLIQRCKQVQLIVTSREALQLKAEWIIALTGLSYPVNDTDEMPSAAVDLFIARWAQRQVGSISAVDLNAIRQICLMVEGLPLAIELAAALTRRMTLPTILDHLQNGFDALTTTVRDVPERQRGMNIVFDMSWRTLSPTLKNRLASLAVFHNGFTAAAAQDVAQAAPLHLSTLLEKSLVRYHAVVDRYTLHPVIRAYAAEKRPASDSTSYNHSRYYLDMLIQHTEPLRKQTPQESIRVLEPDSDNIRVAWQTALAHQESDWLLDAMAAFSIYYQMQSLAYDGEAIMHATIRVADEWEEGRAVAARAGLERARFQNRLGRYQAALHTLKAALETADEIDDRWAKGMGFIWWGESLWRLGSYPEAEKMLTAALELAQGLDDTEMAGWCHHQFGILRDIQGNYDSSLDHLKQALGHWERLDNAQNRCNSLNSIGIVYRHKGDLSTAQQTLEQALALCTQVNNRHVHEAILNNLSTIAYDNGDYTGAQYYIRLGLKIAVSSGNLTRQSDLYINLGVNEHALGNLDAAQEHLERGTEIARSIKNRSKIGLSAYNLASLYRSQHKFAEAYELFQQALGIAREDRLHVLECKVLIEIANLMYKDDTAQALNFSARAITLAQTIQNPQLLQRAYDVDRYVQAYVDSQ